MDISFSMFEYWQYMYEDILFIHYDVHMHWTYIVQCMNWQYVIHTLYTQNNLKVFKTLEWYIVIVGWKTCVYG
jgi:hypothetical protein